MKIKRKAPKSGRPAFVVGWAFAVPTTTDLKVWFDLEYGGPLRIEPESGAGPLARRFTATHALWRTTLVCPLPAEEAGRWKERLQWGHEQAAVVLHRSAPPSQCCDVQLFLGRLARGLTLLSEGTAYDVAGEAFLNPSDWRHHPLTAFSMEDHVSVVHMDAEDPTSEWFRTAGLGKFGLDELETARPRGLASRPTVETLLALAGELLRRGQNPPVGSTLSAGGEDLDVHVVSHRTIPHTTGVLPIRRVCW